MTASFRWFIYDGEYDEVQCAQCGVCWHGLPFARKQALLEGISCPDCGWSDADQVKFEEREWTKKETILKMERELVRLNAALKELSERPLRVQPGGEEEKEGPQEPPGAPRSE